MIWRTMPRRGRSVRLLVGRSCVTLLLALALSAVAAIPASAGSGTWTSIGPKGVGLSAVAVSPSNSNVLIAAGGTPAAGDSKEGKLLLYRSADGGKSWTQVAVAPKFGIVAGWSNVSVRFVEFDPKDANVVYASIVSSGFEGDLNKGTGLYRSADGGKTWKLVYEGDVTNLAISPASPSTVYLAAYKGIEPGCYKDPCPTPVAGNGPEIAKSTDRGLTWKHLTEIQKGQYVAVSPTNANALLVGGASPSDLHLLRISSDGGKTWTGVRSLDGWISHPVFDRSGKTLYAAFSGRACAAQPPSGCKTGIVRSTDGGRTWDAGYTVDDADGGFHALSLLTDPLNDGVLYVQTVAPGSADYGRVLRSADRGSTFSIVGTAIKGLGPRGLALDGASPQTLYAATSDGVWAYTFPKVTAPTATSTAKPAATATTPPASTATTVPPTRTPVPTAAGVKTAAPSATPDSASATATPTPAKPIAAASPTSAATATPTPDPAGGPPPGSTVVLVGAGAGLLAIGALAGRRLARR